MKKIQTINLVFRNTLTTICFLSLFFSSLCCTKRVPSFDMYYRKTYSIPVGINPFVSTGWTSDYITSDTSTFFTANSVTASRIVKVIPKSMQMSVIYPSANTALNVLTKVEVFIKDLSRPNAPELTIFYRDNVPLSTSYTLDLLPNAIDVKDYIVNNKKFNLKIVIQVAEPPLQTIETQFNVYFAAQTE